MAATQVPINRHLGKEDMVGFPGGSVVKNPPASAGFDPSSRNIPHTKKQLSLCITTTEPMLESPKAATTEARALRPVFFNNRSRPSEKPEHHS